VSPLKTVDLMTLTYDLSTLAMSSELSFAYPVHVPIF